MCATHVTCSISYVCLYFLFFNNVFFSDVPYWHPPAVGRISSTTVQLSLPKVSPGIRNLIRYYLGQYRQLSEGNGARVAIEQRWRNTPRMSRHQRDVILGGLSPGALLEVRVFAYKTSGRATQSQLLRVQLPKAGMYTQRGVHTQSPFSWQHFVS